MANNTLAEIRARLAAAEQNKNQTDSSLFPFWNAKQGTTSIVRFLPDLNPDNGFFWVEKLTIRLPFNGIKGGNNKEIYVNVPCVEMWKSEYPQGCPILSDVRAWYKDSSLTERANRYWKKPTYILQGFVRESAVLDEEVPENPIRRFVLNKQLYNLVKAGILDTDMDNSPVDYENGSDFRIIKTSKGTYDDYGTSSFARKETSLTKSEREAIEKWGLSDLSSFMGKKPTADDLKIIREMFEASVDGEAYDTERWGKYYRPIGMQADTTSDAPNHSESVSSSEAASKHTSGHVSSSSNTTKNSDTDSRVSSTTKSSAADVLKSIRERASQSK